MVRAMGLAPSLLTQVRNRVRKLQRALYVKAKTEPDFGSTACGTRPIESMFWSLPANVAAQTEAATEWMVSDSKA